MSVGPKYEFEDLSNGEIARWDELVANYPNRELFHRKAWLEYLQATRKLEMRYWAIRESGRLVGYFCGGILQKGPFRILGSPLKGWATNFLGPLITSDVDQPALIAALDVLARRERLAMIEIENPVLSDECMYCSGYVGVAQPTYVVTLTPADPEQMWKAINVKSRQKVRKARRLGVTVEESTDSSMTDEFFDQFVEVLARKNLFPPYRPSCPRTLFEYLKPKDLLFAFVLRAPNGRPIATGMFPHDERSVYFWGGGSRINAWGFSPNDLLQWTVMETAAKRGLTMYNMCSYGYFRSKFGGTLVEPKRWHKAYSSWARLGRRGYAIYFQNRIHIRGWLERIRRSYTKIDCCS